VVFYDLRKVLESILDTLVGQRLVLPHERSGIYHIGMQDNYELA
jgi:hypothetical protein